MTDKKPLAAEVSSSTADDVISAQPIMADRIPQKPVDKIYRPPPGNWLDGLCDWYKNLLPSCFCSTFACHGVWLLAQIALKTKFLDKYLPGTKVFWLIVGVYCLLVLLGFILYWTESTDAHHIGWVPWLWVIVIGVPIRLHVVNTENLNGGYGLFAEGAIGLLCSPCSVCQLGRHVFGYTKVFDGDGALYREDKYFEQVPTNPAPGDDAVGDVEQGRI